MKWWFVLLFSVVLQAQAQTVLFRHAEADFESYQTSLRSSSFRLSPMDELERRLKNDELPVRLQQELNHILSITAQSPLESGPRFESFYQELEQEPRSVAIRETMKSVLDRMMPEASPEEQKRLQIQIEMLKNAAVSDLRLETSPIQKEIQARLRSIQKTSGGEDLTLFWNGIRWNERLPISNDQKAQWILMSSQWKPRLIVGTWSEISPQIGNDFQDWVSGTCQDPLYQDASFVPELQREALFESNCIANQENFKRETSLFGPGRSFMPAPSWKPVIWTGIAVTALVMILNGQGKKMQFRR